MEVKAVIRASPPRITVQWNAAKQTIISQKIYRRLKGELNWVLQATLTATTKQYIDDRVTANGAYEYFVHQVFAGPAGSASGYLSAGIRVPEVQSRGRVIVLVDDTMEPSLTTELAQLDEDLVGDGWTVHREMVSREATPPTVRARIQTLYQQDPQNTKALYLLGHVPVPYSGDLAADGHVDHYGAWPTDAYYGDIDGVWTDTEINDTVASREANQNVPGDGKFDQSTLPSDLELAVGRVDFAMMGALAKPEEELLRQYLNRAHQYRHRLGPYSVIYRRGLIDDEFSFFHGEAFAANGWRNFTALFGSANTKAADWLTTLKTQKYLFAYGCGGGSFASANNVATTNDFATTTSQATFVMLFGSYFGDWNTPNNFLRAPLGGPATSMGLASVWGSRPYWVFQPLGLGATLGECARITQNNWGSTGTGYDANVMPRSIHAALMGDPTLRLHPVRPPKNLKIVPAGNGLKLSWSASTDAALEGYLIMRGPSAEGPFEPLRKGFVKTTSYVDRSVPAGATVYYRIQAVKRETSTSGLYLNSSQGLFSPAVSAPVVTGPEIQVTGNGEDVAAADTTPSPLTGTEFGRVVLGSGAVTRTFTVTNLGTTTLNITASKISSSPIGEFKLVAPLPATIAAGADATFQVSFQPTAVKRRTGTITLTTNDLDEKSFTIALGGDGVTTQADLATDSDLLEVTVAAGGNTTRTFNISNAGDAPLTPTVQTRMAAYGFVDSDTAGGPSYAWQDISTTGNRVPWGRVDDAQTGMTPIGFDFPFYGANYSQLEISTNGYLTFTDGINQGPNGFLPSPGAAGGMIAPFWNDLVVDNDSDVYWGNVGGDFVVQYDNVMLYEIENSRVTCQAILKPSGQILFQYKSLVQSGNPYTVGIQNRTCDEGVLVAWDEDYVHNLHAVSISPAPATWLSAAPVPSVAAGGSEAVTVTINASGLAPGEYSGSVSVLSNLSSGKRVSVPVRLTVQ